MESLKPAVGLASEVARFIWTDFVNDPKIRVGAKLPSLREFAQHYGVSLLTASNAVSILTAKGWVKTVPGSGVYLARDPQSRSKSVSDNSAMKIGLVIPDMESAVLQRITKGITKAIQENGCRLEIALTDGEISSEKEKVNGLIRNGLDGIIVYPVFLHGMQENHYLGTEFRDFPIVTVDVYSPDMKRPHIVMDNKYAGSGITSYLIRQGRKKIAFLKFTDDFFYTSVEDRISGYYKSLEKNGLLDNYECVVKFNPLIQDPNHPEFIHRVLEGLFSDNAPDALISINDAFVPDIIHFAEDKGISIPQDLMIGSFDNIYHFHTDKTWASTSPDFEYMGHRAVEMVMEIIKSGDTEDSSGIILQCPVVTPQSRGSHKIKDFEKKISSTCGLKASLRRAVDYAAVAT